MAPADCANALIQGLFIHRMSHDFLSERKWIDLCFMIGLEAGNYMITTEFIAEVLRSATRGNNVG